MPILFFSLCNSGVLCKSAEPCKLSVICAEFCNCWWSNVEFQTHVNSFAICTFCRRCDICSTEELMSYAVLPFLWGIALILEPPLYGGLIFWRGFGITRVHRRDCCW